MDKRPKVGRHGLSRIAAVMALFALFSGCRVEWPISSPRITFITVPHAGEGGREAMEKISGTVSRSYKGRRIVLYAKTDVWWIQPTREQPFTTVDEDGRWSNTTHLGGLYAALLVDPRFLPPPTTSILPKTGGDVVAEALVEGETPPVKPAGKPIRFSGYDWYARADAGEHGGRTHAYDSSNVWVDQGGLLHLKITKQADSWVCSEVSLKRSLGYGTYSFRVKNVSQLEPAAELSMFTYNDNGGNQDRQEMDINISQRGDPESKNAEYMVQPYYRPLNVSRFVVPAGEMMYSFDWEPESITFATWRGAKTPEAAKKIAEHTFATGVPVPGGESARINFCPFGYPKRPMQHEAEVVIESFQFFP